MARLLLSLGGDAGAVTAQKRSPLHYAASKGQAGLAGALLEAGAAVDGKDCTGNTPLHRAAATGRVDVVKLLLDAGGAKLDARNREQQTPLLLAAMGGHHAAALLLAGRGADVEVRPAWCMARESTGAAECCLGCAERRGAGMPPCLPSSRDGRCLLGSLLLPSSLAHS